MMIVLPIAILLFLLDAADSASWREAAGWVAAAIAGGIALLNEFLIRHLQRKS